MSGEVPPAFSSPAEEIQAHNIKIKLTVYKRKFTERFQYIFFIWLLFKNYICAIFIKAIFRVVRKRTWRNDNRKSTNYHSFMNRPSNGY